MPTVNANEQEFFPAQRIYDPAAGDPIQGADANHSVIVRVPRIITVDGLPALTTLTLQAKVHFAGAWHTIVVFDGDVAAIGNHVFDPRWNFVQLVRAGSGTPIAHAQT